MKIVVLADDPMKDSQLALLSSAEIELIPIRSSLELTGNQNADAYFDFRENEVIEWETYRDLANVPIFVHAVIQTLPDFPGSDQFVRINAWPGFLKDPLVEACAKEGIRDRAAEVLQRIGLSVQWVADTPGMVAPRILAMIINEAYFALGEGVSTKDEIDTAMKLGTNYPNGPFEWAGMIGIRHIYRLLEKLQTINGRYEIAPALESEMSQIA
jgi:3-hydroxybutyryl-CoA dehydrogenase